MKGRGNEGLCVYERRNREAEWRLAAVPAAVGMRNEKGDTEARRGGAEWGVNKQKWPEVVSTYFNTGGGNHRRGEKRREKRRDDWLCLVEYGPCRLRGKMKGGGEGMRHLHVRRMQW